MDESPPFPSLQPEILVHIFHKLPIKSIHKCKLVCKEWLSLISDPFFKSNYSPSSIPNHPLNLIMIPYRMRKLSPLTYYEINTTTPASRRCVARPRPQPLPFTWTLTSSYHTKIMGSCNGLVALFRPPGEFYLFNPYTAKEDQIKVHVDMKDYSCYPCVLYGLCYDNVNGEHKAVFCVSRQYNIRSFYVVNFKNRSWKLKTQPQTQNLQTWGEGGISGTIVKNVPYWVCVINNALDNYSIMYFDMKVEEFTEAPRVPKGEKIWGLGTLDEQLTASLKSDLGMEVWALKEHGNGYCCWSMLFVIRYDFCSLSTLTRMVNKEEVLTDANRAELMVYNVRDGRLRKLHKTERRKTRSFHKILVYLPSLISPI